MPGSTSVSDDRSSDLNETDGSEYSDKSNDPTTFPTITKFSELGHPPETPHMNSTRRLRTDTILLSLLTMAVAGFLLLLSPFLLFCTMIQRFHVSRLRYRTSPSRQRIAVIGGGWSGLQCMARLRELGVHDVNGFERYDRWGGTWHPALRYHSLQIHGAMWITSFKDFPYSVDQDVNDGKVSGQEALRYIHQFGQERNLMEAYTFNTEVIEIKYSTMGSTSRVAMLVLKDSVSGETRTEGPFDLVIYAAQASEPHIPDIPGQQDFQGTVYHSIDFKKEQYDDIVQHGKQVVIVGGSKTGSDLALCFQRGGYDKFRWLYRTRYHFWKYEAVCHNRSVLNTLRGFTTIVGMLMTLVSERLSGWIFCASGLAVTYGQRAHNDWSKFHFGVLCPKQRRDLAAIPTDHIVCGNPKAFTKTGIELSDGSVVDADVVLFATGCESGIDKIRLTKVVDTTATRPYTLETTTTMLDHFLVPEFPVLANASALWTTFGPVRAVNSADMAVYHLCVRRFLTEKEMLSSAMSQFGTTDVVSGFVFQRKTNIVKTFLLIHLDLLIRGYVNVADFLKHVLELFCLCKQSALKIRLPELKNKYE